MAQYKYKAQDHDGKRVAGMMSAADLTELQQRLKEKELYLLTAEEKDTQKSMRQFKPKVLAEFSRQLGTLIRAGVPLVRALAILANEESAKPGERKVYEDVLRQLRQGVSLSDAMEAQNGAFPPLMIYMYRSAESSGDLDETALKMASLYEKEHRMNAKITASLTYPKILGCMLVAVILIITNFILPRLQDLLGQADALPLSTKILIGIGNFMSRYWYFVIAGILILWAVVQILLSVRGVRRAWHKTILHMPIVGNLLRTICTARFARTLSSLYAAGIPIISALQIARRTTGNEYIDAQFDQTISAVRAGNTLSTGLNLVDGLVRRLPDSALIGEETGSLDTMLTAISDSLEYDADVAITRLVSYIEPVMLILMGILVAFVLVAVFSALYGSYDVIAGMA